MIRIKSIALLQLYCVAAGLDLQRFLLQRPTLLRRKSERGAATPISPTLRTTHNTVILLPTCHFCFNLSKTRGAETRSRLMDLFLNRAALCLDFDRLLDCLFVAGMHRRRFFDVEDVHAEVTDFVEAQSRKSRDCFADPTENILDRVK